VLDSKKRLPRSNIRRNSKVELKTESTLVFSRSCSHDCVVFRLNVSDNVTFLKLHSP
jgi:hypothetical protein